MRSAARSAALAARITRRIAPASRRAAWHRCNACRRTCRASRRAAKARSAPSKPTAEPKADANQRPIPLPTEPAAKPRRRGAGRRQRRPRLPRQQPAKKPSSAQVAAIRSACRADYQRNCASVPPGGAASLNCLEQNKAKLSASCQQAVNAAGGGAAPAAGGAAAATPAAPAAAPATMVLRPMRPREELFVLRSACGADVRALCGGIPVGGRPHRALPGRPGRIAVTRVQGGPVVVCRTIIDQRCRCVLP